MTKQQRGYGPAVRIMVLSVALAGTVAACASAGGRPIVSREPGTARDKVTITADNQNFLDADVYALWNGQRDRVGFVVGKTTQTFDIDWRAPDLQLQIDFVAGGSMTTDRISVYEGDHVELTIPPTQ